MARRKITTQRVLTFKAVFDGPWQPATLLEELRTNVLRGSMKPPRGLALQYLCYEIMTVTWIHGIQTQVFFQEKAEKSKAFKHAITTLDDLVPEYISKIQSFKNYPLGVALMNEDPTYGELMEDLYSLHKGIHKVLQSPHLFPKVDPNQSFLTLPGIAYFLAAAFRRAMADANPGLRIGVSNDGPLARFIAAIVPSITGETPTVYAVAQALKRKTAVRHSPDNPVS